MIRPDWYDARNPHPRDNLRYIRARLESRHLIPTTRGIARHFDIPCEGDPECELLRVFWEGFVYRAEIPSEAVTTTADIFVFVGVPGSISRYDGSAGYDLPRLATSGIPEEVESDPYLIDQTFDL